MADQFGEWRPDPFGRHQYRYWDGAEWTEHVSDHGSTSKDDPVGPANALPPPPLGGVVLGPASPQTSTPVVYVAQQNNGLAIASMVLGIVWLYWVGSVLAVIFGHVALSQIKQSNETQGGRGMAIAGLVLGYVGLAFGLLVIVIVAGSSESSFG